MRQLILDFWVFQKGYSTRNQWFQSTTKQQVSPISVPQFITAGFRTDAPASPNRQYSLDDQNFSGSMIGVVAKKLQVANAELSRLVPFVAHPTRKDTWPIAIVA